MDNSKHDHVSLQMAPRRVAAMAKRYPAGYQGYAHSHSRGQFLYAASGSMRLTIQSGSWIIPPKRAVWLPPGYTHQTGSIGPLEMRTLYIKADVLPDAPGVPRMLHVSSVLHELVLRVMEMPVEYEEQGHDGRVIEVLLGEIDWTPVHPVTLPSLHDERLRAIEAALVEDPANNDTLEDWSQRLGVSSRTLTRLFRAETNLSFQKWRDQIRTFAAIPMLSEGTPLAEIADALGFETAWSFTAMFKRVMGKVPSKYHES